MNPFRGPLWLDSLCVVTGTVLIVSAFFSYGGPRGGRKRLFWLSVIEGGLCVGLGLLGWF